MNDTRKFAWFSALLALPLLVSSPAAASSGSKSAAPLASEQSPLASHVVEISNGGLSEKLVHTGGMVWTGQAPEQELTAKLALGALPDDIPDISTTGLLCQLLTLQPAQGCLETQLSGCTTQSWCTSNEDDRCTTGDWCTIAAICTNTKGCTDAGQCTQANGCTGTAHCTQGAGCTQHESCTNGTYCTNDAGLCTGGATCTKGTGCTAGDNCTAGSGCTKDAQCTKGDTCTKGTSCTSGKNCTSGASCKKTASLAPGVAALSLFDGASMDDILGSEGGFDPLAEPHFGQRVYRAELGFVGLLLLPGLLRRRRR